MLAPPTVKLDEVRVVFDKRVLFDRLSLELGAGEWTCLLGRSGTGKSTLGRFVVGLDTGTRPSGTLTDGEGKPLTGRVAWMAQEDLLLPWLTVLENVTLGARLRGGGTGRDTLERARTLLSQVGLGGTERALPGTLSGGMRQRVALARTLMEDREVVVLDEPFAAVDAITRTELQDLAFEMLRARTILLITHDPLEALRVGDAVYVLQDVPISRLSPVPVTGSPLRQLDSPAVARAYGELLRELAGTAP